MIVHSATRLLWVAAALDPAHGPLFRFLKEMPHIDLQRESALPANLDTAALRGREPLACDPAENIRNMEALDALARAARERTTVALPASTDPQRV